MEKPKKSSLFKRVATALVLAPLTIALIYAGSPWINVLALVFGAMLSWEWAHMVPNRNAPFYATAYTTSLSAAVLLNCPAAVAAVVAGASLLVWFKARGEERRNLLTLGVPYISVGIGSLIWLFGTVGFVTTLWFLIMVWCVDIGGYVVGCNLKGPKLAPKISPNKTWSGLIGGVVFSVAASVVFSHLFSLHANALFYAVFGGVIAVIAQIGDLVESYIKRSIGIKDSSNLIPGHGGVFDRVDGLIFTAPLVALWFKLQGCAASRLTSFPSVLARNCGDGGTGREPTGKSPRFRWAVTVSFWVTTMRRRPATAKHQNSVRKKRNLLFSIKARQRSWLSLWQDRCLTICLQF